MLDFFRKKIASPKPASEASASAPAPSAADAPVADEPAEASWTRRLAQGLSKTRAVLNTDVADLFAKTVLDEAFLEELEERLILADCGAAASAELAEELRLLARRQKMPTSAEALAALRGRLAATLAVLEAPPGAMDPSRHEGPLVVLVAGVNGAGKTTTIAKLAKLYRERGQSVLLGAADTFRAAAVEQLAEWASREGVQIVSSKGADPASVAYDAACAAKARGVDVAIVDTAGRLPTQLHLMEEIAKARRAVEKALPGAPQERLLVVDSNVGQNALAQIQAFDKALDLTGLIFTKLDGTAKGGVLAAVAKSPRKVPVLFLGVGESSRDLIPFDAAAFSENLFSESGTLRR